MDRRTFLSSAIAAAALPAAATAANERAATANAAATKPFRLKYAPHFGMFARAAGKDTVAQLEWAAERGFRAWEDNNMMNRSTSEQNKIAKAMERLGISMGVFVCNFGTAFGKRSFVAGNKDHLDNFLDGLEEAVEVAKRVNATWMTVVLGDQHPGLRQGYQDANAIEMLRRGAEVLEPHNLVMVMEPLNFRDHSGMYLERSDHAYMLAKAVDSPAVKILFDIYHQAASEGNLIPNIDLCWDEIGYFQIGDNPGRREPGTGEVNYRNIFKHIHQKGFDGILGMEHGNSQGGVKGDEAVISAYLAADNF